MLTLTAMSESKVLLHLGIMFIVCAVTRNNVEFLIHANTDCEEQGWYFCCYMHDCRCIVEEKAHVMSWKASVMCSTPSQTPTLPKSSRKPLKSTLTLCNKCDKDPEGSSAQLLASGGGE